VTVLVRTATGRRHRAIGWVVTAWVLATAFASITEASWPIRRGALFLHLGALVAGFGAVLVVDLHGVLWLIGRRRLDDLLQISSALNPVIWGGLVVLVASGLLLHPNVMLLRTQVKLVLVLVATLNGMWAHHLSSELRAQPPGSAAGAVDQRLLVKVMGAGAISQGAWWGATLIGFLATTSR
jgi:hypothetical protein